MTKKTIFVPEINLVNWIIFYIISFSCTIKTYRISPFLMKLVKNRISIIKTRPNIDWQEYLALENMIADKWDGICANFIRCGSDVLAGTKIDSYRFVAQIFKYKLEILFILNYISKRTENSTVINDYFSSYLNKLLKNDLNKNGWLSELNIFMSEINIIFESIINFVYSFISFMDGLIKNKKRDLEIKYIYEGVSILELSVSKDECTFSWIIDDKIIKKNEVFFLLPIPDFQIAQKAYNPEKNDSFIASCHRHINRFSKRKKILKSFIEMLKHALLSFTKLSVMEMIKFSFKIRILKWIPLIDSLKPKVYIATSGTIGLENPVLIYLNAKGIKTITWCYGGNYSAFFKDKMSNSKHVILCNLLSSQYIVWHKNFKNFIEEHHQYKDIQINVLGPLMSSHERVMESEKKHIANRMGINWNNNLKYLSFFDSPPVSEKFIQDPEDIQPLYANREYNSLFIKDILNLLDDFDRLFLILKPKRSLTSGKFYYSEETKNMFSKLKNNPRVKILDYLINPWLVLALSDICVATPFGSPVFAALHYGKPGIFHDPMNIALIHRYNELDELITHSYLELKNTVGYWLNGAMNLYKMRGIEDFIGNAPMTNSSDKFRKYLSTC